MLKWIKYDCPFKYVQLTRKLCETLCQRMGKKIQGNMHEDSDHRKGSLFSLVYLQSPLADPHTAHQLISPEIPGSTLCDKC